MTNRIQKTDRYGNRLDDDVTLPDGGTLRVPLQFADSWR
jgi:hypothetical protein